MPALCHADMAASGMLVSGRDIGDSSTDTLEISHKALLLLGQVKQLLTEVGCKRPVLELAVMFDIILQDANWPTLH